MPPPAETSCEERRFVGIGVAPGIITGVIHVHGRVDIAAAERIISMEEVATEITRFEEALIATRKQLQEIQKKVSQNIGESDAALFDAHLLVLEDPSLIDEVVKRIRDERHSADYAFDRVAEQFALTLSSVEDEYLRERSMDIRDVAQRVLRNLHGTTADDLHTLKQPCIVVAYDLAPSDTANIDKDKVIAFATDIGSKTSHTAIMARAMSIPSVVGLHDASEQVQNGALALLDGYNGVLIIHPSEQTLYEYGKIESKKHSIELGLASMRDLPAQTQDGCRMLLAANIEMPNDVPEVLANGADGVGLFRTEYVFINRTDLPTEDEQYEAYVEVARRLKPRPVVIRTLDLGGDKFLSHLQIASEMNPFLGWRAIRFCLEQTDIFRTQLRAILRASAEGNVRLMYPMISGLGELRKANTELERSRQELRERNMPFGNTMPVGTMIEVPSAAVISDLLARECAFFSIGTNDLIQYALAVDRVNERIAHLYEPTHPAIIRLLRRIVEAAHHHHIEVSVCGEMAGDVALTPVLVGLGVNELSVSPSLIPQIKKVIRSLSLKQATDMAKRALEIESGDEIRKLSADMARAAAPDVMELIGA